MPRAKKPPLDLARTPFTGRAERKVRLLLETRIRPANKARIVVAVSGGPDSTALAVILSRLAPRMGLELTIAHLDHRLRSRREARGDAGYVSRLGEALDVRVVYGEGDTAAEARARKTSREDAARHLRYAFLQGVAKDKRSTVVALGHTLDDRAETVLMHIVRGSGLAGIASMEPVGRWPYGNGPLLYRPLLTLRRDETVRYCREVGLEPRDDPTNALPVATRNIVRSRLMPLLREFNPRIEEALSRLGEAAALDAELLAAEAGAAYVGMVRKSRGGVALGRDELMALHPALRSRVIALAAQAAGTDGTLQALHLAQVSALVDAGRGSAPLPGGVTATVTKGMLKIRGG